MLDPQSSLMYSFELALAHYCKSNFLKQSSLVGRSRTISSTANFNVLGKVLTMQFSLCYTFYQYSLAGNKAQ